MKNPKATILIIDDDVVDTKFIKKALEKGKVSNAVMSAENGEEGLKILRAAAVNQSFLVLLDLNMPRMDGHEFLDALRADEDLKHTVVFVVTTSNDDVDKWKAYRKNVSGYIVKERIEKEFIEKVLMIDHFLLAIELPPLKRPNIKM